MERCAPTSKQVVGTDRTIFLARNVSSPNNKPGVGFSKLVELLMEHALAKKDDAVGAAGRRRGDEVIKCCRRDVAHRKVAIAVARGFTDIRKEFEEERMCERKRPSALVRSDDDDRAFSTDRGL